MKKIIKKISAMVMSVGMLMTTIPYSQATSLITAAIESETSDAEESVHIWDGTTDISWYDDEETEFHISTPEQLAGMAAIANTGKTMEGKTFILDNDVYLNDVSTYDEWETTPPENKWTSIDTFNGTFIGENHNIIGMYFKKYGMFKNIENGKVLGVHLEDFLCIHNYDSSNGRNDIIGALAAYSKNSYICNFSVNGKITIPSFFYRVGGIVGCCESSTIINCSNTATIVDNSTDSSPIGGICGIIDAKTSIINCINYGDINTNYADTGGIVGRSSGKIVNCKNSGVITRTSNNAYIGGIVGRIESSYGEILNSYNTGKIEGNGICGDNHGGTIKNVYNTGTIENGYAIASSSSGNAYYLSGTALEGGPNTIAKTEANMKKESFADSLGSAFYYVEGEYPKLAFEVGRTVSNFDKTSLSFKEYGETQTLTLDTTYLGTPEWISSDSSVATVDENGVVTAVGNGTAMIYALCSDSKAACSVSVGYDYYLSDNELSLKKGRIHDVAVYSASTNEKVMDTEIEWSSSDDSIVSVDSEGKLTANNKGTAVVTVKIADMELSCIVSVYEYTIPVIPSEDDENAPKLSETEFSISTIESKKLSVMNYADSITWVSSNTAITKVNDQGLVRAVAEGQAAIYALLSDGKCLKADVTVTKSEYSMGDVNLDGKFDVADVVLLQKWLLAIPDTELKHWENADFYEDGILNVFDLCMMREQLIS